MQTKQPSFYWYDYETWGLSPSLDRISQFAGVRTGRDFTVIGSDMFYCRLSDDYLPSPEAAVITCISPATTQAEGLPEYAFAQRVNQQFCQANTCVVGYNTVRFDDEFSRNIFYRNFYDPYEYSWRNGNSRWDIIDLVRAAHALRPGRISWPKNADGETSFRLELLSKANGIEHTAAHDARSDVYATIALAKLIKDREPKLFDYYFALRDKQRARGLIDCAQIQALVHVSGMFGIARNNISLIAPIAWHPVNKNAVISVDLLQDLSPLIDLPPAEIRTRLYTKKEQLGDNLAIPLKQVHINKCPFIAPANALLPADAERLGIDQRMVKQNLKLLTDNPTIAATVKAVFTEETPFASKENVDARLYDGFFPNNAKAVFERIRQSSAEQLATAKFTLADDRFNDLLFRYRARNFPQSLSTDEQSQWEKHKQTIFAEQASDYFKLLDSYLDDYRAEEHKYNALRALADYARSICSLG